VSSQVAPYDVDVLVGALGQARRQAVALRARLRVLEAANGVVDAEARLAQLELREEELEQRERQLERSAEKLRRRHAKLVRRKQELAEHVAEPEVATQSEHFNLLALEQRVAERRDEFPELAVEWESYLLSLRTVADTNGNLPATVDALVDEVFAPLF
jgi:chromosome segregation ATPase